MPGNMSFLATKFNSMLFNVMLWEGARHGLTCSVRKLIGGFVSNFHI